MSRSRKKEPVYKGDSKKWGKKQANKKHRSKIKDALHHDLESMPKLKEVFDTYNIFDFKHTEFKNPDSKWGKKIRRK